MRCILAVYQVPVCPDFSLNLFNEKYKGSCVASVCTTSSGQDRDWPGYCGHSCSSVCHYRIACTGHCSGANSCQGSCDPSCTPGCAPGDCHVGCTDNCDGVCTSACARGCSGEFK